MKHFFIFLFILSSFLVKAQVPDAAYVRALYKKYPTQRSSFCPSCLLWVNPYFKSIGDTLNHTPKITFYIYTKAHREEQERLNLPRKGIYGSWHSVAGQPDETKVYRQANKIIGKPNSAQMIAKGHCQAWILLAWTADAAILSDTYTFNAGMEYQGQNVGTEIATEELCRKLTGFKSEAVTDSVKIWCGTFGSQNTYTKSGVQVTVPTHYYKIIQYYDPNVGGVIALCYWMPNLPDEKKANLKSCIVSYEELVKHLGYEPKKVFN